MKKSINGSSNALWLEKGKVGIEGEVRVSVIVSSCCPVTHSPQNLSQY